MLVESMLELDFFSISEVCKSETIQYSVDCKINASAVALNLTTIDLGQKGDGKSCQTLIFCTELRDLLHWVVH